MDKQDNNKIAKQEVNGTLYSSATVARLKGLDKGETFALTKLFPNESKTITEWEKVITEYKIK